MHVDHLGALAEQRIADHLRDAEQRRRHVSISRRRARRHRRLEMALRQGAAPYVRPATN